MKIKPSCNDRLNYFFLNFIPLVRLIMNSVFTMFFMIASIDACMEFSSSKKGALLVNEGRYLPY